MLVFILGIIIGLIVGWNLLPQPAWVLRLYDKIVDKIITWISPFVLIGFLLSLAGCTGVPGISPSPDAYPWLERATAEIALASVTNGPNIKPDSRPVVGSKCPDCNDPPGACGVGKTGDGRTCNRCETCRGDGRIDEQDLRSELGQSVLEVPKEITLHATSEQWKSWPIKWYSQSRPAFESQGWIVRVVLEPAGSTDVAYFDVQAPDGELFNFFEPLTIAMVEHLETR
jgi:hypothetical protein